MRPYRAVSIDDEVSAHNALRALLEGMSDITFAGSFVSAEAARGAIVSGGCDLLFLDIAMPELSGLDFLRSLENPPVTVLLTAHVGHALEAFQLGVRDYLLKPVARERLQQCLDRIRPLLDAAREGALRAPMRLSIKCGSAYRLIDPVRTVRAEAAGNFSILHADGQEIFASESLKDLHERLAPFGFLRIHKSHLVALRFVASVTAGEVLLQDGGRLPLGRAYRAALSDVLGRA